MKTPENLALRLSAPRSIIDRACISVVSSSIEEAFPATVRVDDNNKKRMLKCVLLAVLPFVSEEISMADEQTGSSQTWKTLPHTIVCSHELRAIRKELTFPLMTILGLRRFKKKKLASRVGGGCCTTTTRK